MARGSGAVRSPGSARHDAAALAGRHVWLAQPGRDDAWHQRLGTVRRVSVGSGRSAQIRPRRVPAVASQRRGPRAAEPAQSAAGAREGTSTTGSNRPGCVRSLRLRRFRSSESDERLLGDHRARRHAAAVGARLHAVAPDARRRHADRRHRGYVPQEADSARRLDLPWHRIRAARVEHEAAVIRLQSGSLQAARRPGRCRRSAREACESRRSHGAVGSRQACPRCTGRFRRGRAKRWTGRTSRATGSSTCRW